ncbi:Crp/Fnr family transcriptional regulator [Agaribacter flavus]|uniref:Crp/Fnr family transcriptional regulator n=1 Tax=Agaribacter flavus TaxID=1902781 RepID=A0ABV7FPL8_9ALTE
MNFEDLVNKAGKPIVCPKYNYVFRQGDNDDSLYFLKQGLLKAYYIGSDGKETIKSFIQSGNVIGNLGAMHTHEACTFNVIALQDSQLIQLPFSQLIDAVKNSHEVAQKVITILMGLSVKKERREYEFLSLSAEERYKSFCNTSPQLLASLTQRDIALYLGITPVALSRIKKRIDKLEASI